MSKMFRELIKKGKKYDELQQQLAAEKERVKVLEEIAKGFRWFINEIQFEKVNPIQKEKILALMDKMQQALEVTHENSD